MNWATFQTYGESPEVAFERLSTGLFRQWGLRVFHKDEIKSFRTINGRGGDGGIEAYYELRDGTFVCIQAKWFRDTITSQRISQIADSLITALRIRPSIKKYIVSIPRNLTSEKMVRGGKITENSEDQRWRGFVKEVSFEHPNLEIILWDEAILLELLQTPEAEGALRYWFHDSSVNRGSIELALKKQLAKMTNRYIPELHSEGLIKDKLDFYLGAEKARTQILCLAKNYFDTIEDLIISIEALTELKACYETNLFEACVKALKEINLEQEKCSDVIERVRLDCPCNNSQFLRHHYPMLSQLVGLLEEIKWESKTYNHSKPIINSLRKLRGSEVYDLYDLLEQFCAGGNLVITGESGSGKTSGVCGYADNASKEGFHTPIVVFAKDVSHGSSWKDIIINTLGLSDDWSENALFGALSACAAYVDKVFVFEGKPVYLDGKVMIFVDGLDESSPYEYWIEQMRTALVLTEEYPQVKFCFSMRPYVLEKLKYDDSILNNRLRLPDEGDVPVGVLFDKYIKTYDISVPDKSSIKWTIRTPLALKLFCQLYKGQKINDQESVTCSLSYLLRESINEIEKELCERHPGVRAGNFTVQKVLTIAAKLFIENSQIDEQHIIKKALEEGIQKADCEKAIDILSDHGAFWRYKTTPGSPLSAPTIMVHFGIGAYFDYAIALSYFENIADMQTAKMTEALANNNGALQMFALMMLEQSGLVFLNNLPIANVLTHEKRFDLTCFALCRCMSSVSAPFADSILQLMSVNAHHLTLIVNRIVLPVSREPDHPLGPMLLHWFLLNFDVVAERDMIWSVPPWITADAQVKWFSRETLELFDYPLSDCDAFSGLPLIYAWRLSTVNNNERVECRNRLIGWAIETPENYAALYECMINVNDPQVVEDVIAIASGLVCHSKCSRSAIQSIGNTTLQHVFSGKDTIWNAAIRHYGRIIGEICHEKGLINKDQLGCFQPPYCQNANLLTLSKEASEGTAMNGYGPIHYDLSRYVLCDPICGDFLNTYYHEGDHNTEISQVLSEAAAQLELQQIEPEQFVISMAYQQILDLGWSEEECFRLGEGRPEEVSRGVDVDISRAHYHSSHGSRSPVMTLCEKYIWCSKHVILGYLADRLPLHTFDNKEYRVSDYSLLDNFENPFQEYYYHANALPEKIQFRLPEDLSPCILDPTSSPEKLVEWIESTRLPDFEKWIRWDCSMTDVETTEPIVLNAFLRMSNPLGAATVMWISAGIIQKSHCELLIEEVKDGTREIGSTLREPDRFHSYPNCDCYISPYELCAMPWKRELSTFIDDDADSEPKIKVFTTNIDCVDNFQDVGDVFYKAPTKTVRQHLCIRHCDGLIFKNIENQAASEYFQAGEDFGDRQKVLIADGNKLFEKLEDNNEIMFWSIRILRKPSSLGLEKYPNLHPERDCCLLAFQNTADKTLSIVPISDEIRKRDL